MEPPTTTTTTTTYEITRKQIGCTRKCIDRLDSNPNTHRTTHTIAPHTKIAQLNTCNTHTHTHTHHVQAPIATVADSNKYNIHACIKNPVDLVNRTDRFDHLYINNIKNCDNNPFIINPNIRNENVTKYLDKNDISDTYSSLDIYNYYCNTNTFTHDTHDHIINFSDLSTNLSNDTLNLKHAIRAHKYTPQPWDSDSSISKSENINLNNLLKLTQLNIHTITNRKQFNRDNLPSLEDLSNIDTLDNHSQLAFRDNSSNLNIHTFLNNVQHHIQNTFHALDTSSSSLHTLSKSNVIKYNLHT
eukprot:GHVR01171737.1.p1 GENE.GHVR01171737.1~~GHVR01171737.1.p1  ORF type:complete len:301 (+),score=64.88 GHVR01171737.1:697-1599(+)